MILPGKHLRADRALIGIGAKMLTLLDEPKTVSSLWAELKQQGAEQTRISFDWFILALDLLHLMGTIEMQKGKLTKVQS